VRLHLGIDDTDSRGGGCTTHAAAVLVEKLSLLGCRFIDYPNIIRLNPNIPYKTRGNAAVAIRIDAKDELYQTIENVAIDTVEKSSRLGEEGTDPALVILRGDPGNQIKRIARSAMHEVVSTDSVVKAIKESGAVAILYGAKLGVVGATAAIGHTLPGDHTFELIAYRTKRYCGSCRRLEKESVKRMHRSMARETFNSYDEENRRVLIAPHGPDPVLVGIRGETAEAVLRAFRMIKIQEPVERWMIFRTNHGTDAHFQIKNSIVHAHSPAIVTGTINGVPRRTRGGHVFCSITRNMRELNCAAFEPTGSFRKIIAELLPGDKVTVFGGVHADANGTINLEKIIIHKLAKSLLVRNPSCRRCNKRLKSAGRGKGFKCTRCGLKIQDVEKVVTITERKISPGLYLPSQKAHRHLTKPMIRYGREKTWDGLPPIGLWHNP
jgi:tRNA(Ile2)-agmatinylcytidine synthase